MTEEDLDIQREERAIYAIMIAACAPVVIALVIEGGVLDGGATLSLAVVVLGFVGLIAGIVAAARARRNARLPRATARHRS
jgi:hypothetical protein